MTQVSFPGLFGDKVFSINPVAFSVLGREIRWYGIIICVGIILTVLNTIRCAKKEGISTDDVLDYAIWAVPFGIIGARAYYVLTSLSEYDSFSEAIAIWNGGIAIYGAVIAGAITVFIVSKVKKIKFTKMADSIGASIFIGQFLGRWGNFCNGEAFGTLGEIDFLGNVIKTPNLENNYFLRMSVSSESTFGITVLAHP
ncbi:MAG: prolipoprotein diacylglyceryl transferase, partial [Clostridia bacterium]|nr:prolipoprotein diacylglyceryl transferase [Clostridia bacterium]